MKFDDTFDTSSHIIELADCSRQQRIVTARGDAKIQLIDIVSKPHDIILKNTICIPSYKQNILSVYAMTERSMKVAFSPNEDKIIAPNGTSFYFVKKSYITLIMLNYCSQN